MQYFFEFFLRKIFIHLGGLTRCIYNGSQTHLSGSLQARIPFNKMRRRKKGGINLPPA